MSYTLSDDAGGLFAIDGTSGIVTLAGQLDYETSTSHDITVLAQVQWSTNADFLVDVVDDPDEYDILLPIDNDSTSNGLTEDTLGSLLVLPPMRRIGVKVTVSYSLG